MKKILVVGGAGYIGAHMCKLLAQNDYVPVVLDNLSTGHRGAVKYGPFIEGSIANIDLVEETLATYEIAAVMHFAAFSCVGESVAMPAKYYRNNVENTLRLLDAMIHKKINKLIFSSSCAIYGEPIETPITEKHPQNPINPYGWTKLMMERILNHYDNAYEFKSVSLRYFNAAGADPEGEIGEDHRPETHLIPLLFQVALKQRRALTVFGDDYPTYDGTCIRDYIHVMDLVQAHYLALERLLEGDSGGTYNLGNGKGYSVKEVIDVARQVTGQTIPIEVTAKRFGDAVVLIGSSEKAIRELGWNPCYPNLTAIVEDAWRWHKNNPQGYVS